MAVHRDLGDVAHLSEFEAPPASGQGPRVEGELVLVDGGSGVRGIQVRPTAEWAAGVRSTVGVETEAPVAVERYGCQRIVCREGALVPALTVPCDDMDGHRGRHPDGGGPGVSFDRQALHRRVRLDDVRGRAVGRGAEDDGDRRLRLQAQGYGRALPAGRPAGEGCRAPDAGRGRAAGVRVPDLRDAGRGERRGELPRLRTLVVHEERLLSGTFQAQSTDPGRGRREGRGGSAGRRDPRGGLRRILRPVRAGRAHAGEEPVQCPRQLVVKARRFARREVADGDEDTAAVHEADERVHASILARTAIEDEPAATGRGRLSPRRRSVRTAGPPASRCCR